MSLARRRARATPHLPSSSCMDVRQRRPAVSAIASDENTPLLSYFGSNTGNPASIGPWELGPEPYLRSGCHPDVVERLWKELGGILPRDCRCRIGSNPALAHPISRLIFGVAIGTQYAIRVPAECMKEASALGLKTSTAWGGNERFDLAATFGPGWHFGAWQRQEVEWCRLVYASQSAA